MKKLVVLIATVAALVPVNTSTTTASSSASLDRSAGAYQGANRMDNAASTDSAEAPPPTPQLSTLLQQVLDLTNAERVAHGLVPLTHEAPLSDAARTHSQDQADRGELTHTGSDGSSPGDRIDRTGYEWRTWAENAAAGYGTADRVVVGWMNSEGHRENILNPNVTEIGLGVAYSAGGRPYWTQVFAAPR